MIGPNELNSFTLRTQFEKPIRGTYYTFTGSADALLNSVTGIGEVKAFVKKMGETDYAVSNDGQIDVTLNGTYCYLESTNGSYVYYPVRGGLPDGTYEAVIQFKRKNGSGQWDPRLSTRTLQFTIVNQVITF